MPTNTASLRSSRKYKSSTVATSVSENISCVNATKSTYAMKTNEQSQHDFNRIHSGVGTSSFDEETMIILGREIPRRKWSIFLYSLSVIALFADQNLMAPNLSAIGDEFGFDDNERDTKLGGNIALAFFFVGGIASMFAGFLTDHIDGRFRSRLFALMIILGEGSCFMVYFVKSYNQLFLCRTLTGISVGAAPPMIYSVLSDLYEAHERNSVSGVVSLGQGLGIGCGQLLAGFLGPRFNWRTPFLVTSIPAICVALLLALTVQDPPRGAKEMSRSEHAELPIIESSEDRLPVNSQREFSQHEKNQLYNTYNSDNGFLIRRGVQENHSVFGNIMKEYQVVMNLLKSPTIILMMLQASPGCLPWGVINTYLNDFLAQDRGMGVEGATVTITVFGFGLLAGMLFGGRAGEFLYRINVRYPSLLMGSAAIVGTFTMQFMINSVHGSAHILIIALVSSFGGFGAGITGPIVKATLANVTLPNRRGRAFALFTVFNDVGNGLGPAFVAILIVKFGRKKAFNLSFLGWILCGAFNILSYFTVKEDEEKMKIELIKSKRVNDDRRGEITIPTSGEIV